MKTVLDSNSTSIHVWQNTANAQLTINGLVFEGQLVDPSLTTENATIVDCGTPPVDWYGREYLYLNGEWVINPNKPV